MDDADVPGTPAPDDSDGCDSDDEEWHERYPSERVRAAPVTETTAGIDVSRHDLDDIDLPPMFGIHEHYPPEDDVEDTSVWVHGEHAALQVAATIADLAAERFDERPDQYDCPNCGPNDSRIYK